MSLQTLPPDVLRYVIFPYLQSSETRQDIHHLLHPSPPFVPIRNLKWAAEAIETMGALRETCRDLRYLVDQACGYQVLQACSAVSRGLDRMCRHKEEHTLNLRRLHGDLLEEVATIAPSCVSDGCFVCGAALPHCWPLLHWNMWPNSAEMRVEKRRNVAPGRKLVARYSAWCGVGCCSHSCYEAFYAPILRTFPDRTPREIHIHECAWCEDPIHPSALLGKQPQDTGDPLRPYFCSHACWSGHFFTE